MLLQNPQLAYALLQAQIVMKIVDPQVAMVTQLFSSCLLFVENTQPFSQAIIVQTGKFSSLSIDV